MIQFGPYHWFPVSEIVARLVAGVKLRRNVVLLALKNGVPLEDGRHPSSCYA
jgi:hypothetical protein